MQFLTLFKYKIFFFRVYYNEFKELIIPNRNQGQTCPKEDSFGFKLLIRCLLRC